MTLLPLVGSYREASVSWAQRVADPEFGSFQTWTVPRGNDMTTSFSLSIDRARQTKIFCKCQTSGMF